MTADSVRVWRQQVPALVLGTVVSAAALWLVLAQVDLRQVWTLLSVRLWETPASAGLVVISFVLQLAATAIVIRRWQAMLRPYPTRFWRLTQVFFVGHLLNTLLPAKLGTVARVALAAESERLNGGFVFSSVAAEKVLDTLVMFLMLAALAPFTPLPQGVGEALAASALLVVAAAVLLLVARRLRERILASTARLERRLFGQGAHQLYRLTAGAFENMAALTRRREALEILFWTACAWGVAGLVNQALLNALGIVVPMSAAWVLLVSLQIGTRLPSLPANLGVFHFTVVVVLAIYGVDPATALAYAVLLHVVIYILPAFIGAACAFPISARLSQVVWDGLNRRSVP